MHPLLRILLVVVLLWLPSPALRGESINGGVIQVRMPQEDISLMYWESSGGMTVGLEARSASVEARNLYLGDGKVAVELKVNGPGGNYGILFQNSIKLEQGFQFKKGSVVKVLPGYKRIGQLVPGDIYVTLPGVVFALPSENP